MGTLSTICLLLHNSAGLEKDLKKERKEKEKRDKDEVYQLV